MLQAFSWEKHSFPVKAVLLLDKGMWQYHISQTKNLAMQWILQILYYNDSILYCFFSLSS